MKAHTKPKMVEYVIFTGENRSEVDELVGPYGLVHLKDGIVKRHKVNINDVVIKHPDGSVTVMDKESFHLNYEIIHDPSDAGYKMLLKESFKKMDAVGFTGEEFFASIVESLEDYYKSKKR